VLPENPLESTHRKRVVFGLVLALVGAALFWMNIAEGPMEAVILSALGAAFVAGYFYNHSYGLLIPGCILLGLGLGELLDRTWFGVGDTQQLGLGVGFLAIYVVDRMYRGRTSWWPLVPGVILVGSVLADEFYGFRSVVEKGWPLILVAIGLAIMSGAGRRHDAARARGRDDSAPKPPHEI
jgi:hypothetical protein